MYIPESLLSVRLWHLSFYCTSKFQMGNLYPLQCFLCIRHGNFQCLHLYSLTILGEKKRIHLPLMCVPLSTTIEWSQPNCFLISNIPFGDQQSTVNKLCTTILLQMQVNFVMIIYMTDLLVITKLYIKR